MIKTRARSLGRALGRVIGKALGRTLASDDDNDAPYYCRGITQRAARSTC